jgi:uncharacterized protein YaaN involved in tellurite resistance
MGTAVLPKHVKDESKKEGLLSRIVAFKDEVLESDGGPMLDIRLKEIGLDATKNATRVRALMQSKVGDLLKNVDGESPSANQLLALRETMDTLNPHSLRNDWKFKYAPEFLKKKMLRGYAEHFESNQDHVNAIFMGLLESKDALLERVLDLSEQYKQLKLSKEGILEEIYVGEGLWEKLEGHDVVEDVSEKQKLDKAKNAVSRRIRDLRVAEQAIAQFMVSINQTAENSQLLTEAIESALLVGPVVLINAVNIQVALGEQKNIANALDQFQSGLGEMMVQNATAIEDQTTQIHKLYNNPVVGLDYLETSYDKLANAISNANEAMNNSTLKARELSTKLAQMSEKIEPIVRAGETNETDKMLES